MRCLGAGSYPTTMSAGDETRWKVRTPDRLRTWRDRESGADVPQSTRQEFGYLFDFHFAIAKQAPERP